MKMLMRGAACVVVLAATLGLAQPARAATGVFRVMVSGALAAPSGASTDGYVTLRIGVGLPVFLVSDGGAVIAGSIATATFAQWSDSLPTPGFGSAKTLIVFRQAGGVMIVAGAMSTPSGTVTTFSATDPVETLSGTWTLAPGSGTTGGPGDAVITFTYDTNPSNTLSGVARIVADNLLSVISHTTVSGLASVDVARNVPVRAVVNSAVVNPPLGTLVSYSAFNVANHPGEYVELVGVNVGGVVVLYACAFPQLPGGIACLVGGAPPLNHLSGTVGRTAGEFLMPPNPNAITGVDANDLVDTVFGSLP